MNLEKDICIVNDTIFNGKILLYNLTKRIDNLEDANGLDYKFWIPTGIAIVAIVASIYQFCVQNKNTMFYKIESEIDNAYLTMQLGLINLLGNESTKRNIYHTTQKVMIDTYLNKLNDGCRLYFNRKLTRKLFRQKYDDIIVFVVLSEKYCDRFVGNEFKEIKKYYDEIIKTIETRPANTSLV